MTSAPVLVLDDHVLIRTTLVMALRTQGLDAHHVPLGTTESILAEVGRHPPGLVLLDLDLGEGVTGGADLVRPLRSIGWAVLVVTAGRDRYALVQAVAHGAVGWVDKSESFEHLLRVALDAVRGHEVLSAAAREEFLRLHHTLRSAREEVTRRLQRLTARERQVLDRLAAGRQAAAVAEELGVSVATVRAQIRAVLTKLDVRTQLAAVALVNQARADDPVAQLRFWSTRRRAAGG